jgi:MoaA/NifB/PqqE/SkfB family radical SAM enzyme
MAKEPNQRLFAQWMHNYLEPGSPGAAYIRRLGKQLNPAVRKRFLTGFISGVYGNDLENYKRMQMEEGITPPHAIAISPSMRCNLRCAGCYAGNYSRADDLPDDVVERIVSEAEELGAWFFIVIGGEPFMWPGLLDLVERHPSSIFQVYTNGTMIDDATADRIARLGNIAPALSIEGDREKTDARRGRGTYDKVIDTMERLRDRGVLFSFSATATRENIDIITSDEFIDLMIEKGALYGWYFAYMPIGLNPDLAFMPTPEERDRLRRGVVRIRKEKPILVADFWNDGALTGGCLAAGREYVHINNKGDVEPCVFCHFAVDNIKESSLLDALKSPFFKDIRRLQPFGHNLLRPCPLIDHPGVMRKLVDKHDARPTHEGAESLVTSLAPGLQEYAAHLRDVYEPVWREEYGWVAGWLSGDPEYQRRGSRGKSAEAELSEETACQEVPA